MTCSHTIIPYKSVTEDNKKFEFGMTPQQVAAVDPNIFAVKENNLSGIISERRGGYSTDFINDKLTSLSFRIDPGHNKFEVEGIDISDTEGIDRLKAGHENYGFSDGKSILFPSLGIMWSISPFCEGWNDPRPGVFNNEIVVFSKEMIDHHRRRTRVIDLDPLKGISIAGSDHVEFTMSRGEIHKALGSPEYVWKDYGAHKHIVDYYFDRGFCITYNDLDGSRKYHENMPLYTIDVIEKNGWQVEVNGVRIFEDDKLIRMKKDHEFIESKKQKAVAFPDLGIFTVGCGEKKNTGKGAEGKTIMLCNKKTMPHFTKFIDMWD